MALALMTIPACACTWRGVSHMGGLTNGVSCRSCKQGSPASLNHEETSSPVQRDLRLVSRRDGQARAQPTPRPAGLPPPSPSAGGARLCFSATGGPSGRPAPCCLFHVLSGTVSPGCSHQRETHWLTHVSTCPGVGGGREHCGPSGRPRMPRSAALHFSNWTDRPLLQTSSSVWPPNVPVTTPVPELRAPALLPAHAFGDQAHPVASWVALRSPAAASWGLPHSSPRPLSARAGFPCPPGEPLTLPGYLQPWPSLSSPTDAPVGRWPILFPPLCPGPPGRVSPRLVLRLLSVVSVHAAISLEAEK